VYRPKAKTGAQKGKVAKTLISFGAYITSMGSASYIRFVEMGSKIDKSCFP